MTAWLVAGLIVTTCLALAEAAAILILHKRQRLTTTAIDAVMTAVENIQQELGLAYETLRENPVVRGSATDEGRTLTDVLRERAHGIAPYAGYMRVPPVDESIPTSAKLPPRDPGDRDEMEVEVEDTTPLSADPPTR